LNAFEQAASVPANDLFEVAVTVTVRAELRVLPGKHGEFFEVAAALTEAAAGEPGTLRYDWYRSDDAGLFIVIEEYTGSEAALAHNEYCGGLLGRMAAVAEVVSAHIHGRLGPELEAWVAEHPFAQSHAPLDDGPQPPAT
jgi:hypothetical protein